VKTVLLLEQQGHTTKVKCKYTRNFAFKRTHAQAFTSSSDDAKGRNERHGKKNLAAGLGLGLAWDYKATLGAQKAWNGKNHAQNSATRITLKIALRESRSK
jgi:hypothetical protein